MSFLKAQLWPRRWTVAQRPLAALLTTLGSGEHDSMRNVGDRFESCRGYHTARQALMEPRRPMDGVTSSSWTK